MLLDSRQGTLIILFLFALTQVRGQGIELIRDFEIVNSTSFPLKEHDMGISFRYATQRGARVKSYLRVGSKSRLLADNIEIKGLSVLSIASHSLKEWFLQVGDLHSDIVFYLEAVRTKKTFEKRYRLSFAVDAPYGRTFLQEPAKPNLLPTNATKRTTNDFAIGGLVVSAGMIIGGATASKGSDTKKSESLLYGGLLLGLLSVSNISTWKPDDEINERNRFRNQQLERDYVQEREGVLSANQLIKDSFRISVRILR